jgi:histidinol-phosphatase (PHP family)
MRVDLHNHTTLCNHAEGTPREYIQKAIEIGIDVYGFSDHNPMEFDKKYRMSIDDCDKYESDILSLKKEYSSDIEILLAYEVDYLKEYIPSRIKDAKVDYLIGSVHFIDKWDFDNPEFIGEYKNRDIDKIWEDYFGMIEDLAKSRLFNIIGHLDLIKVFKFFPKKDIKLIAQNALKEIKNSNMAIEINSAGLRKPVKETYPSHTLLQMAYEMDIPITFSSDAHAVSQVGFGYEEAKRLAKDIGYDKCAFFREKELIFTKID